VKNITKLVLLSGLFASSFAFADAPPASARLNNAQVAIAKKVLLARYKNSVAIMLEGEACMKKVVTDTQMQSCMQKQTEESLADQEKSEIVTQQMQKDMDAAATK